MFIPGFHLVDFSTDQTISRNPFEQLARKKLENLS